MGAPRGREDRDCGRVAGREEGVAEAFPRGGNAGRMIGPQEARAVAGAGRARSRMPRLRWALRRVGGVTVPLDVRRFAAEPIHPRVAEDPARRQEIMRLA
jgi:hypothetical protein